MAELAEFQRNATKNYRKKLTSEHSNQAMTLEAHIVRIGLVIVIVFLSLVPICGEQLPIRTYTTADGLARDQVYRIVTDPRGFIWFCTSDGLSRFDGYEFTNYSKLNGLPSRTIYDLLITRRGDYWVATSQGLARFNAFAPAASKFEPYTSFNRPSAEIVNRLFEDSDGTIWVGSTNGLHRLKLTAHGWELEYVNLGEKLESRLEVTSFVEDSPGVVWMGSREGLYRRYRDGKVELFTTENGLPHNHIRDVLKDSDGTLWVATGLGLCRLVPEVRSGEKIVSYIYTKKDGLLSENIFSLHRTKTGWLWASTTLGVSEFSREVTPNGGHFLNYTREHGISDSAIRTITEDHDGNLWIGSESGGAMKVTRRGFISFSEADGLESGRIAALGESRQGEFYVITNSPTFPSYHIHLFDGRRFQNIKLNLPPTATPTWGWNQLFVEDSKQHWWVPTTKGIFEFPALPTLKDFATTRALRVFTKQYGLGGDEPFRLFEDSRGDLWISIISVPAVSYLNRVEHATGKLHSYSAQDIPSLALSTPTAYQEDRQGNVWIGFYFGGLTRYRSGEFESFTKSDGMPAGMIRAMHLDSKGRLWIASGDGGLARVDDPTVDHPTFNNYTVREGLSSDQVTCITEDEWGRIYVGTGIGVDRLDPSTGRLKRYTVADGLPNGFVNVAYRDRNNALWFGTLQGLSRLIPTLDPVPQPPPILIQGLRVAGNELPISDLGITDVEALRFDANKNQVEIKFLSLGFLPGEVLRYQFMLQGADHDWGPATNLRTVNYANLKPGSYRFLVRAVNADGVSSTVPASVSFTIVPPIWQRWWFLTLAAATLIAAVHFTYRYHTRRLIELERVRTRIATDLHDDIGASLSKIAILSEVAEYELAAKVESPPAPLAEIAETSRDCVDSMSDIVWAVNPQRDHLSDLTQRMRRFAEDLMDAKDISFNIRSSIDDKDVRLGADLRREVYLIFKECVNNLVKHSECTDAALAFSINKSWLEVSINDNGRGFASPDSSQNGHGMGGHGLASMQRRAESLGGRLNIDSAPGSGTRVTLKVPIRQRSFSSWWASKFRNGQ